VTCDDWRALTGRDSVSADLSPDPDRFVRHCKWLLAHGAPGSRSSARTAKRNRCPSKSACKLLEALIAGGVPPSRLMPGTGCSALPDSVRLTAHAAKLGCAGVLMLPPFYYKGVSDDGLLSQLFRDRSACRRLAPAGLPVPHPARERRADFRGPHRTSSATFPDTIAGIKDSSNDWNNTRQLLDAFRGARLRRIRRKRDVSAAEPARRRRRVHHGGSEREPARHRRRLSNWQTAKAEELQSSADAIRGALQSRPDDSALKAVIAHYAQDPLGNGATAFHRPFFVAARSRCSQLDALDFTMPDIRRKRAPASAPPMAQSRRARISVHAVSPTPARGREPPRDDRKPGDHVTEPARHPHHEPAELLVFEWRETERRGLPVAIPDASARTSAALPARSCAASS
jgi:4-hydroxy-tetrahydrodipicolinate synthase